MSMTCKSIIMKVTLWFANCKSTDNSASNDCQSVLSIFCSYIVPGFQEALGENPEVSLQDFEISAHASTGDILVRDVISVHARSYHSQQEWREFSKKYKKSGKLAPI